MSTPHLHDAVPGIGDVPLIGILRKLPTEEVLDLVDAANEAGVRVVEVTLDSEGALGQIRALAETFPGITVGAGSVRSPADVANASDAGARFIVAPITRQAVANAANSLDVPHIAGAATPTEIYIAIESGSVAVKVFPIEQLGGPAFLKAILSPLGDPPLIPTGGVSLTNARDYLAAGAKAVGVGSAMFSTALMSRYRDEIVGHLRDWVTVATT